jgi:hypothetical protein
MAGALAVDPAGIFTLAWAEGNTILAVRSTAGGAWSSPATVLAAGGASNGRSLAFDASGSGWAVWPSSATSPSCGSVSGARFVPGTGWSAARVLWADPSFGAVAAKIVVASSGAGTLVLSGNDCSSGAPGITGPVESASLDTAGNVTGTVELLNGSFSTPNFALAGNSAGDAHAAIVSYGYFVDGAFGTSMVLSKHAGSAWSLPFTLLSNSLGFNFPPVVASVAAAPTSGGAIAVSAAANGPPVGPGERLLQFAQFSAGAWPSSPSFVRPEAPDVLNPAIDVALDDLGGATLLRSEVSDLSQSQQVLLARLVPGFGWTPDVALSNSGPVEGQIRVALDRDGHGLAVWINRDGSVSARRFE